MLWARSRASRWTAIMSTGELPGGGAPEAMAAWITELASQAFAASMKPAPAMVPAAPSLSSAAQLPPGVADSIHAAGALPSPLPSTSAAGAALPGAPTSAAGTALPGAPALGGFVRAPLVGADPLDPGALEEVLR